MNYLSPRDYINEHKFKELTELEIKAGKKDIKITGTKELMPWTEVYTRISAGMSMEHIALIYGHGRKISLWAEHDGIKLLPEVSDILDGEIIQRRKMNAVEVSNPEVAKTIKEMVNEYAPDTAKLVVELSRDLIKKGSTIINDDDCTSSDMLNVAKAVQTMTDTTQISERFSTNAGIAGGLSIHVEGFSFKKPDSMIEAEIVKE